MYVNGSRGRPGWRWSRGKKMGQNENSPYFIPPLVLLQRVTVSTRWRKGSCSITLPSETEIRVLSLELHGTHTQAHASHTCTGACTRTHYTQKKHTFLQMDPHESAHIASVFPWITRDRCPLTVTGWMDASGQVWHESCLMPVFALG